jgi:hypothetical protein
MLDLHYGSFGRGTLCNRTVWSELKVGNQSSRRDLVRGSTTCHHGLVGVNCQLAESARIIAVILLEASHAIAPVLAESARIIAVILLEASHAIAPVLSEPTVSCQSLHVLSP